MLLLRKAITGFLQIPEYPLVATVCRVVVLQCIDENVVPSIVSIQTDFCSGWDWVLNSIPFVEWKWSSLSLVAKMRKGMIYLNHRMGMKQEDDLVFLEVTDPSDTFPASAPLG